MNYIKYGDRIRVVRPTDVPPGRRAYTYGSVGEVIDVKTATVRVRFDHVEYEHDDDYNVLYLYEFEKIGAAVTPPSTPKLQWTTLVGEKSRTYHFADGSKFTIENATHLAVRPTNHRLQTEDGKKFIVPGTFVAIEIDAQEWSA